MFASLPATSFDTAFSTADARPDVGDDGIEALAIPRFAALFVASRDDSRVRGTDWLSLCYQVTTRVERIAHEGALLGLGLCDEEEAIAVVRPLAHRLAQIGLHTRVGIGPSLCLAQLAALAAPASATLVLLGVSDAAALLYHTPVALLTRLHPTGSVTAEHIERLERYGLRTCGRVARLGALALCRQFGEATGRFLFAVCRGVDPRPLQPTPQRETLRVRLRLAESLSTEAVRAMLPQVAERLAKGLARRQRRARELHLTLHWVSGARHTERTHLREHLSDPRLLATELERLLTRCLPSESQAIAALVVTASDLAPAMPAQLAIWGDPERRQAAILAVADALAHRYDGPVLLTARLVQPDAIFDRNRYRLTPLDGPLPGDAPPLTPVEARDDPWRDVPHRLHWW